VLTPDSWPEIPGCAVAANPIEVAFKTLIKTKLESLFSACYHKSSSCATVKTESRMLATALDFPRAR
jgi:hypothetical protein